MSANEKLDILAFAPHPDDAELFCGGLLATAAAASYRTGIVDLSEGELSSQGALDERAAETRAATAALGLACRENLRFPDGRIGAPTLMEDQLQALVSCLRRHRPDLVLLPHWECRHPDHEAASELVSRSIFFSGTRKFRPECGPAHQPLQALYYPMRFEVTPSFICDVTSGHATKMEAIRCYQSQIVRRPGNGDSAPATLISSPLSVSSLEARARYLGAMIGVEFAEAYVMRNAVAIRDPLAHFRAHQGAGVLMFPRPS